MKVVLLDLHVVGIDSVQVFAKCFLAKIDVYNHIAT